MSSNLPTILFLQLILKSITRIFGKTEISTYMVGHLLYIKSVVFINYYSNQFLFYSIPVIFIYLFCHILAVAQGLPFNTFLPLIVLHILFLVPFISMCLHLPFLPFPRFDCHLILSENPIHILKLLSDLFVFNTWD